MSAAITAIAQNAVGQVSCIRDAGSMMNAQDIDTQIFDKQKREKRRLAVKSIRGLLKIIQEDRDSSGELDARLKQIIKIAGVGNA